MKHTLLKLLVVGFLALPSLASAAFPELKSKEEMLPVLFAAIKDADKVVIGKETFEISWADEEQAQAILTDLIRKNPNTDFSNLDFEKFGKLIDFLNKLLSGQLSDKDRDSVFVIAQTQQPGITRAEFDGGFTQLISEAKKAFDNLNSHERKSMDFAIKLLNLKEFDYISKVGEGKVKQRYRVKYYDYEDKKTNNLDFYLKSADKPKAKKPAAAKSEATSSTAIAPKAKAVSSSSSTSTTAAPKVKKDEKAKKKEKKAKKAKKAAKKVAEKVVKK